MAEVDLPGTEGEGAQQATIHVVAEMYKIMKKALESHIDAVGHEILPFREEDVVFGKKYVEVIGEIGSVYFIRKKYQPENRVNWGVRNADLLEAFFNHKGIKKQTSIAVLRCGSEWYDDSNGNEEAESG